MIFNIFKNVKNKTKKFKFYLKKEDIFEQNQKIQELIKNSKKIYFLGISGIGMSALATLYMKIGKKVLGSTDHENEITKKLSSIGIEIFSPHSINNIDKNKDIDLLIYTEAVDSKHIELIRAKELNIPFISYGEGLSYFFNNTLSCAIAGTHGKSSTTAILTEILRYVYDTFFLCGSVVKKFGTNGGFIPYIKRNNKQYKIDIFFEKNLSNNLEDDFINDYKDEVFEKDNESLNVITDEDLIKNIFESKKDFLFIGEACEYKETFQNFFPSIILITSLEEDHLDYYKNSKNYLKSFKQFIEHFELNSYKNLPYKNIILHVNSKMERKLAKYICSSKSLRERAIFYTPDKYFFISSCSKIKNIPIVYYQYLGFNKEANLFQTKIYFNNSYKKELGFYDDFDIFFPFPSEKYGGNITGAYLVARSLKVFNEIIYNVVKTYGGIERRFDFLGIDIFNNKIYTDYAHHPSEIQTLLEMMKEYYPQKKIVFIFQPHQYSRTYLLFNQFLESFYKTDLSIILPIYKQRDSQFDINRINSNDLVHGLIKKGVNSLGINDENELFNFIENNIKNSVIIFAGAGDIYNIAKNYLKNFVQVI